MRRIKMFEEFVHDEIYDVMMSICDTVSFRESEKYPSTDKMRVYETNEPVYFDKDQYEGYLSGWSIMKSNHVVVSSDPWMTSNFVVFYRGKIDGTKDRVAAGSEWLTDVYGGLVTVSVVEGQNQEAYWVDAKRNPLINITRSLDGKDGRIVYIHSSRIWNFLEDVLGIRLGKSMYETTNKWLSLYGLEGKRISGTLGDWVDSLEL